MVKHSRRRATTRRRYTRRRRYTGSGHKSLISRVAKLERNQEEPHYKLFSDSGVGGAYTFLAGATPNIGNPRGFLLNGLVKGDGMQNRTGDNVNFTRLLAKIVVYFGTAVANQSWVRWALVRRKNPEGWNPSSSLVAVSYLTDRFGSATVYANALLDVNNKDFSEKWQTLQEGWVWDRAPVDATVEQAVINIDWRHKGIKTEYKFGDTGSAGDIDTNQLYLVFWTDVSAATDGVALFGEARLYFHG